MEPKSRFVLLAIFAGIALASCTGVTQLRNAKTGQTVTCGGEMWTLTSSDKDKHCLDYWHNQGFETAP
jgi:hypothetical protein